MFALEGESNKTYYLEPNKLWSVGRNAELCELVITDDTSISRKHCSLNVTSSVALIDHNSRYGTYINDGIGRKERISPNGQVNLQVGDRIRFGILQNNWRLVAYSFITCCSKLNIEIKSVLQTHLKALQGSVSEDWSNECNFLTMTKITLTHKVIMALINSANIVTPEYWNVCIDALKTNTKMPNANLYLPNVLESTLNQEKINFLPNIERKTLFAGKKFVFFSRKQKSKYDDVVTYAGGTCIALSDSKLTKSMLCSQNVFVIQFLSNANMQESQVNMNNLNNIVNYIESKGKRLIPEAEIALAILYCSVDKYCNPDFDFPKQVCGNSSIVEEVLEAKVLAVESQESVKSKEFLSPKIIEVSLTSTRLDSSAYEKTDLTSSMTGNKRKFIEESSDSDTSKKVKCDNANSKTMFQFLEDNHQQKKRNDDGNTKTAKLLNLILPIKRTRNEKNKGENLFNFECDPEAHPSPKQNKLNAFFTNNTSSNHTEKEMGTINKEKGISQKDLINNRPIIVDSSPWLSKINHSMVVKQEKDEVDHPQENNLDLKLSLLDLGQTTIAANSNLLVKKENKMEDPIYYHSCNFKKFQKVRPLKPQKIIIPKSIMVAYRPMVTNVFNTTESDNEESDNDELMLTMNRKITSKKACVKSRRL